MGSNAYALQTSLVKIAKVSELIQRFDLLSISYDESENDGEL